MGKLTIKSKEYKGWKNCIEISNGIVELIATTDVGPRIISYGFCGEKNVFCEVADQVGTTGGDSWKIYGGHRVWHSPEDVKRTYIPDNSSITWKKEDDGIFLIQPVEELTCIKKEMRIILGENNTEVKVIHRITNEGLWAIEASAWAVSVMAAGGMEILPQTTRDTVPLPNRSISLWSYSKINDSRVIWGDKYIMLKQDSGFKNAFKLGYPNENGWASYVNDDTMFVKKYEHKLDNDYPDYGCSYETYISDFMVEMETLSPLCKLNPNENVELVENWSLYKGVKLPQSEEDIEKTILPLIK